MSATRAASLEVSAARWLLNDPSVLLDILDELTDVLPQLSHHQSKAYRASVRSRLGAESLEVVHLPTAINPVSSPWRCVNTLDASTANQGMCAQRAYTVEGVLKTCNLPGSAASQALCEALQGSRCRFCIPHLGRELEQLLPAEVPTKCREVDPTLVVGIPAYRASQDQRRPTCQREPGRLGQPADHVQDLPLQRAQHESCTPQCWASHATHARRT